ncbi:hypothetical protein BRAS3809_970009 [Bradyrhizobium sp. STM 3809]|nr:hypothetical protein BRAS3809_970009 [Bradyrhizobium sp. STM 3809]
MFERLRPAYCSAKSQTRIATVFAGLSRENNEFVNDGFASTCCSAMSLWRRSTDKAVVRGSRLQNPSV